MNICTKVRESTHLNTITMISRVSSHNLFPTMQFIWNYSICISNCIWMCICICIYICICICNCIYICIWTFVLDFVCACICILHILEWSGGRGRLSSPLMFSINFKSVLQFPSRPRFQFLQTLQSASLAKQIISRRKNHDTSTSTI